ncbi:hypothetical protein KXS11_00040 [Plantibacter flavus]|uniref:Wzz/FepE/Etk N-terminal domain-containing protein n=1 Tax=Plantibacter flavus TaxID=150123 RepID=UPI003F137127
MTLLGYLRAIVTGWWIVVIALVAGLGLASVYNSISTPVYASTVKFFVSTQTDVGGSALAADEFAQRRINSYVQLLTSESMVRQIIDASDVDLSVADVTARINAYSDPETVLLGVEVQDTDKGRSYALAKAVADEFGVLVSSLDNRGDAELANVKLNVVSGPTLNEVPVSPRKQLNLALGAVIGLAMGATIAIVRKTSRRSVGTATELEDALDLPVLATLPRLHPNPLLLQRESGREPASVTKVDIAVERLIANLELESATPRYSVLQVASAHAGDGRSLITGQLAKVLTRFHSSVIVVDADFQHPSLTTAFGSTDRPGLSDYLAGTAEVSDIVVRTPLSGLLLVPAGTARIDGAQGLASPRFATLVEELRDLAPIVLLDTPPLLPRIDASLIGREVDGAVLVVGRDRSTKPQLVRAIETLAPAETLILGTVLNSSPRPPRRTTSGRAQRMDKALGTLLIGDHGSEDASAQPAPSATQPAS